MDILFISKKCNRTFINFALSVEIPLRYACMYLYYLESLENGPSAVYMVSLKHYHCIPYNYNLFAQFADRHFQDRYNILKLFFLFFKCTKKIITCTGKKCFILLVLPKLCHIKLDYTAWTVNLNVIVYLVEKL